MLSREYMPVVYILYESDAQAYLMPYIEEIAHGVEEEGLLSDIISISEKQIQETAYRYALTVPLGISIGIGREFIVLMDKHVKDKRPVLEYSGISLAVCRKAGQNAVRLMKCKPLLP